METDDFLEFHVLQDLLMIPAVNGCKKNQISTVTSAKPNTLLMQQADGKAVVELEAVKPQCRTNVDWRRTMFTMDISPAPRVPDIKWVELYSKWGHFIPEHIKPHFKHYHDKPPKVVATEVKRQAKEAKQNRLSHTRTTTGISVSKLTVHHRKPGK
jgi:hypothetical protein